MDVGGAQAEYVREEFGAKPGVSGVDVTGSMLIPWLSGGVSGTIDAEPGLSDAELAELAYEISDYLPDSDSASPNDRLVLRADGVELRVSPNREIMERRMPVVIALRDDAAVDSAQFSFGSEGSRLEVVAADPDAVVELTRRWADGNPEILAMDFDENYHVDIATADGAYEVSGTAGNWWEPGFDAWVAIVDAGHAVSSLVLQPESMEVHVVDDSAVDAARTIADGIAGPGIRVTVSGGVLTVEEGHDGELGRAVVNALPEEIVPLLTGAVTDDETLTVNVVDTTAMRTVAEALVQIPESAGFGVLRVGTPGYQVAAQPNTLMEWVDIFENIHANTQAARIHLDSPRPSQPSADLRFDVHYEPEAPATDEEVVFLASTLRPLAVEPTFVSVKFAAEPSGRDTAFSGIVDPLYDEEEYIVSRRMEESPRVRLFVETWNATN